MEKIIKAAVERGASDLHIKAGDVFRARINGKLVPLTKQRLTPDQTRAIALKLISSDEDRAKIDRLRDFDCSWGMPGVGRFRVNVLRQRSSFMIVMRVIPFTVPTIESLRLPETLAQIAEAERGLVLVTGVSGSGKSSTVAAMVHHINRTQHKHVVTIENPIEFLHRDLSCSITQREVGVDTDNLTVGVRAALRQDPDVVVLGDIADADTIDTAIKGAETGHLVIASMPTPDVLTTIDRILTTLPREEREIGRMRLSEALRAIVSQQLLPQKDEKARVPAVEILIATAAVRECLKDACAGERPAEAHGRRPQEHRYPDLRPAHRRPRRGRPDHGGHRQGGRLAQRPLRAAHHQAGIQAGPVRLTRRSMATLDHTMRQVLALRREAGSPGAAAARDLVAAHLEQLGYRVERQRFAFVPSSLNGFPVFGAGLGGLGLLQLPLLTGAGLPGWAALPILLGGLLLLLVAAVGIGLGWLPLGESREDENLIATRGGLPIRRWIVAHLDTKAQVQSMAGRLVAVWVIGAGGRGAGGPGVRTPRRADPASIGRRRGRARRPRGRTRGPGPPPRRLAGRPGQRHRRGCRACRGRSAG